MPILIKFVRVVTHHWELPAINPYEPLITWSCRSHEKLNVVSPFAEDLWILNWARWRLNVRGSHPQSHITLWSCDQLEVTWQTEIIFHLSQEFPPLNLTGWWLKGRNPNDKVLIDFLLEFHFSRRVLNDLWFSQFIEFSWCFSRILTVPIVIAECALEMRWK